MSNVGLYLGTFNPIHNGHVTLAEYFSKLSELDEVLVVISPQSPFKKENELISDIDRLKMAETVFKRFDNVRVSDIEFKMSKPNFTIDTLKEFKKRHKYNKLILLIGEDNLVGFNKWKDYKKIHFIDRGYVIHETAIEIIKSSHLLINFNYLNTEKTDMVSGKLIEYLASGSPIINFSNSAEESNSLLKNSTKSFNAESNDITKVVNFIKKEYDDWSNGNYEKDIPKNIESFSRKKLTNDLVELIKNLVI